MTTTIKCIMVCISLLFAQSAAAANYSSRDVECMAKNIYFEARGEGLEGMLMIADVTLNRASNPKFPSTICGVVNERNQFSWVPRNPPINNKSKYREIVKLSEDILSGKKSTLNTNALYFKRTGSRSSFHDRRPFERRVGNHDFYR